MRHEPRKLNRRAVLGTMGGVAAAAALGAPALAQAPQKTLRFASLFRPDHDSSKSSEYFAELVGKKTGGRIKVQVFHNASLGSEDQVGEGVRTGTIDMGFAGSVGFGSVIRDIRVLELPFLYKDFDEIHSVFAKVSPQLGARFAEKGVQLLGYVYEGPRMTLSTKPLRNLADFKGLKLRVPQAPAYIAMANAFGATPTPLAFPEIYTALQAGVADALEGSPSTLFTGKFYEVAKNLARTDHIYNAIYFGMHPATFKALAPDIQAAMLEAGREATGYNLDLVKKSFDVDLGKLRDAKVVEVNLDRGPFREAVKPANLKFAQDLGGTALELFNTVTQITKA